METARLFNSTLATVAISSAFELGLLEELERNEIIYVSSYCDERNLHRPSVAAIFRALACFNIIELSEDGEIVKRGRLFTHAYREKGYFLWLVKGYGHLLQNLADFAQCSNRPSDANDPSFAQRNYKYIAMAGRDYGTQFVDPYFEDMLSEQTFNVACDLGCGSAERLLKLAKTDPAVRGIGVDISAGAVALARDKIREEGLESRLTVLSGDVRDLANRPEFSEVDLLFSFFMGHDLWPQARCIEVFQRLLSAFPRAERFLFCDTYSSGTGPSPDIPTFTLGFELMHAVMGQYIPSEEEWLMLFERTGWRCVNKREVGIPYSAIFDLRPRRVFNR